MSLKYDDQGISRVTRSIVEALKKGSIKEVFSIISSEDSPVLLDEISKILENCSSPHSDNTEDVLKNLFFEFENAGICCARQKLSLALATLCVLIDKIPYLQSDLDVEKSSIANNNVDLLANVTALHQFFNCLLPIQGSPMWKRAVNSVLSQPPLSQSSFNSTTSSANKPKATLSFPAPLIRFEKDLPVPPPVKTSHSSSPNRHDYKNFLSISSQKRPIFVVGFESPPRTTKSNSLETHPVVENSLSYNKFHSDHNEQHREESMNSTFQSTKYLNNFNNEATNVHSNDTISSLTLNQVSQFDGFKSIDNDRNDDSFFLKNTIQTNPPSSTHQSYPIAFAADNVQTSSHKVTRVFKNDHDDAFILPMSKGGVQNNSNSLINVLSSPVKQQAIDYCKRCAGIQLKPINEIQLKFGFVPELSILVLSKSTSNDNEESRMVCMDCFEKEMNKRNRILAEMKEKDQKSTGLNNLEQKDNVLEAISFYSEKKQTDMAPEQNETKPYTRTHWLKPAFERIIGSMDNENLQGKYESNSSINGIHKSKNPFNKLQNQTGSSADGENISPSRQEKRLKKEEKIKELMRHLYDIDSSSVSDSNCSEAAARSPPTSSLTPLHILFKKESNHQKDDDHNLRVLEVVVKKNSPNKHKQRNCWVKTCNLNDRQIGSIKSFSPPHRVTDSIGKIAKVSGELTPIKKRSPKPIVNDNKLHFFDRNKQINDESYQASVAAAAASTVVTLEQEYSDKKVSSPLKYENDRSEEDFIESTFLSNSKITRNTIPQKMTSLTQNSQIPQFRFTRPVFDSNCTCQGCRYSELSGKHQNFLHEEEDRLGAPGPDLSGDETNTSTYGAWNVKKKKRGSQTVVFANEKSLSPNLPLTSGEFNIGKAPTDSFVYSRSPSVASQNRDRSSQPQIMHPNHPEVRNHAEVRGSSTILPIASRDFHFSSNPQMAFTASVVSPTAGRFSSLSPAVSTPHVLKSALNHRNDEVAPPQSNVYSFLPEQTSATQNNLRSVHAAVRKPSPSRIIASYPSMQLLPESEVHLNDFQPSHRNRHANSVFASAQQPYHQHPASVNQKGRRQVNQFAPWFIEDSPFSSPKRTHVALLKSPSVKRIHTANPIIAVNSADPYKPPANLRATVASRQSIPAARLEGKDAGCRMNSNDLISSAHPPLNAPPETYQMTHSFNCHTKDNDNNRKLSSCLTSSLAPFQEGQLASVTTGYFSFPAVPPLVSTTSPLSHASNLVHRNKYNFKGDVHSPYLLEHHLVMKKHLSNYLDNFLGPNNKKSVPCKSGKTFKVKSHKSSTLGVRSKKLDQTDKLKSKLALQQGQEIDGRHRINLKNIISQNKNHLTDGIQGGATNCSSNHVSDYDGPNNENKDVKCAVSLYNQGQQLHNQADKTAINQDRHHSCDCKDNFNPLKKEFDDDEDYLNEEILIALHTLENYQTNSKKNKSKGMDSNSDMKHKKTIRNSQQKRHHMSVLNAVRDAFQASIDILKMKRRERQNTNGGEGTPSSTSLSLSSKDELFNSDSSAMFQSPVFKGSENWIVKKNNSPKEAKNKKRDIFNHELFNSDWENFEAPDPSTLSSCSLLNSYEFDPNFQNNNEGVLFSGNNSSASDLNCEPLRQLSLENIENSVINHSNINHQSPLENQINSKMGILPLPISGGDNYKASSDYPQEIPFLIIDMAPAVKDMDSSIPQMKLSIQSDLPADDDSRNSSHRRLTMVDGFSNKDSPVSLLVPVISNQLPESTASSIKTSLTADSFNLTGGTSLKNSKLNYSNKDHINKFKDFESDNLFFSQNYDDEIHSNFVGKIDFELKNQNHKISVNSLNINDSTFNHFTKDIKLNNDDCYNLDRFTPVSTNETSTQNAINTADETKKFLGSETDSHDENLEAIVQPLAGRKSVRLDIGKTVYHDEEFAGYDDEKSRKAYNDLFAPSIYTVDALNKSRISSAFNAVSHVSSPTENDDLSSESQKFSSTVQSSSIMTVEPVADEENRKDKNNLYVADGSAINNSFYNQLSPSSEFLKHDETKRNTLDEVNSSAAKPVERRSSSILGSKLMSVVGNMIIKSRSAVERVEKRKSDALSSLNNSLLFQSVVNNSQVVEIIQKDIENDKVDDLNNDDVDLIENEFTKSLQSASSLHSSSSLPRYSNKDNNNLGNHVDRTSHSSTSSGSSPEKKNSLYKSRDYNEKPLLAKNETNDGDNIVETFSQSLSQVENVLSIPLKSPSILSIPDSKATSSSETSSSTLSSDDYSSSTTPLSTSTYNPQESTVTKQNYRTNEFVPLVPRLSFPLQEDKPAGNSTTSEYIKSQPSLEESEAEIDDNDVSSVSSSVDDDKEDIRTIVTPNPETSSSNDHSIFEESSDSDEDEIVLHETGTFRVQSSTSTDAIDKHAMRHIGAAALGLRRKSEMSDDRSVSEHSETSHSSTSSHTRTMSSSLRKSSSLSTVSGKRDVSEVLVSHATETPTNGRLRYSTSSSKSSSVTSTSKSSDSQVQSYSSSIITKSSHRNDKFRNLNDLESDSNSVTNSLLSSALSSSIVLGNNSRILGERDVDNSSLLSLSHADAILASARASSNIGRGVSISQRKSILGLKNRLTQRIGDKHKTTTSASKDDHSNENLENAQKRNSFFPSGKKTNNFDMSSSSSSYDRDSVKQSMSLYDEEYEETF